jgi:Protein of unknown function (DUF1553)/Protein of unknown function (DUF1549)/Planctomycete cytochrome C
MPNQTRALLRASIQLPLTQIIPAMHRAILASILVAPAFAADAPLPAKIEFNRDVRPILADTCFKCHGFDKNTREADLRLDVREAALADLGGYHAIVPGKVEASEVWKRINATDPDDVMPPKKEPHQLSARDKAVLRKWIEQGADYQAHWAYLAPVKPKVPDAAALVKAPADLPPESARALTSAATNPVDAFIAARHATLGMKLSPEADRATLARRLSFDLLGLPPKPEEADAFVNDKAPGAYERLVDRLLASPHYGERMAVWWLDLVRFADTAGYHSDNPRNIWPYRDYVIRAFNDNKRFDRFTIEQVAGDLLPDAGMETRVASGYNRLILSTEEGGAQAKQYEAKHVVDRVTSIGTTWLGQTLMCAECHDHKFDPVTTRDFYAMGAFFADIKEAAIGRREDGMIVASPEQEGKLKAFDGQLAALNAKLLAPDAALDAAQGEWEAENVNGAADVAWAPLRPAEMRGLSKFALREDATIKIEAVGNPAVDNYKFTVALPKGVTGIKLEALPSASLPASGPGRHTNGNFVLNEITVERDGKPLKIAMATATFEQTGFPATKAIDGKKDGRNNGWAVMGNAGKEASLYLELAEAAEGNVVVQLFQQYGDNHTLGKLRLSSTTAPKPIRAPNQVVPAEIIAALKLEPTERSPEQRQKVLAHFRGIAAGTDALRKEIAAVQGKRAELEKTFARTLVSESAAPRTVRVLPRGDWQSESGDVMLPATPRFLPALVESKDGKRATRLDLARWLVARENPLTARVFMNRLWKQFYGIGLSKTLEDMGTQSEMPVNQPLLDWLAIEFQDRGWDVKAMVRLLVTSAAYRQTSIAPPDLVARDPANREVARQSRWRLDAEFVRDNALSVAGLIVHKLGGPSVNPYQPAGYWENLNFPTREWQNSKDDGQWRRGLYTWWQRSYPHPMMVAFDAPTREECAADRLRSNIPQQALALLNDPQFVESARALAARMLKDGGVTPGTRIAWAWKQATGRLPKEEELTALVTLLSRHLAAFSTEPKDAASLLGVGYSPAPKDVPAGELAAYTSVGRVILNLHETVTRP